MNESKLTSSLTMIYSLMTIQMQEELAVKNYMDTTYYFMCRIVIQII